nr:cytochrome P450 family 736 subfamily A polypeptide 2 [Ipomoea batatas]
MMNTTWIWTTFAVLAAISICNRFLKRKARGCRPVPEGFQSWDTSIWWGKPPIKTYKNWPKSTVLSCICASVSSTISSSRHREPLNCFSRHTISISHPGHLQRQQSTSPMARKIWCLANTVRFGATCESCALWSSLAMPRSIRFNLMRREELRLLIESFKHAAGKGEAVDLSAKVSSMSANMSCRMVFGKKYEDNKLDIQGLTRRMKAVAKDFDQFFERIIDEHEQAKNQGNTQTTKDFVDVMLEIRKFGETSFEFTREHIKSMMLDLLVTSMDTSSTTIDWTMSELFKHPEIMKKVKKEIERQVGYDRMVEEEDLEHFEYLEMVIKESLRLHLIVPLLVPHASIEDCIVDGFYIPKKSRIIVNTWAIARDPNVWSNPEKFILERFNGSDVDYRGKHFEYLPFGSGRRSCPGMQLGITIVRLVVAQLIHCFDWDLPNGMLPEDLDMTEHFGVVISRAKNLVVVPKYQMCV